MNHAIFRVIFLIIILASSGGITLGQAQETSDSLLKPLVPSLEDHPNRISPPRYMDLLHTRLAVEFDWEEEKVMGLAQLRFKALSYPQTQVAIDAQDFRIRAVKIFTAQDSIKQDCIYQYDGRKLQVQLGKEYTPQDTFEIEIAYQASPQVPTKVNTGAIEGEQGLYFINAQGQIPNTPRQIWTQGETEANSRWFPTLDQPNERATQEFFITVDSNFVSLSNGELVYQTANEDGTRTDYWRMDQGHAPYLAMLAVGEFAIVKEEWKGKEVSYYVEPDFEEYASAIFGKTPRMIEFFSNKLNYPFPWNKYSQVVVRDFVSGAMENTTASVFYDYVQVDSRSLLDEHHEKIIAHELFHQWFGDLVTCESWGQVTLNEAFAEYSEYVWTEHEYGLAEAEYVAWQELEDYFYEYDIKAQAIVRHEYEDPDDLFDAHSYNKGGRVLHMLRQMLGEEVFWRGLEKYLKDHAYQAVELDDLRQALEALSGQDLSWFFDQWFLGVGHPVLGVEHSFQDQKFRLDIRQIQDSSHYSPFIFPLKLQYWQGGAPQDTLLWIKDQDMHFEWEMDTAPQGLALNPGLAILCEIEHPKSEAEWKHQYQEASSISVRLSALQYFEEESSETARLAFMEEALEDPFWFIRESALFSLEDQKIKKMNPLVEAKIKQMAVEDSVSRVRAAALELLLSRPQAQKHADIFWEAQKDSAYSVLGVALRGVWKTQSVDKTQAAMQAQENARGWEVIQVLSDYFMSTKDYTKVDWITNRMVRSANWSDYTLLEEYAKYLKKCPPSAQETGKKTLLSLLEASGGDWHRLAVFNALWHWRSDSKVEAIRDKYREELEIIYQSGQE